MVYDRLLSQVADLPRQPALLGHFLLAKKVEGRSPRTLEWYPPAKYSKGYIPSVIVLWGSRSAQVRIFTDYLVAVREQEYQSYWLWLLDFHNGFSEHPIDNYYSHYACLTITKFKD